MHSIKRKHIIIIANKKIRSAMGIEPTTPSSMCRSQKQRMPKPIELLGRHAGGSSISRTVRSNLIATQLGLSIAIRPYSCNSQAM